MWDGEQILWELRQTGSGDTKDPGSGAQTGSIGYVHGGDIDAPVAMMRADSVIVLHQSWRGYMRSARTRRARTPPSPPCTSIAWPVGNNTTFLWNESKNTQSWCGSLVMDQRDATG